MLNSFKALFGASSPKALISAGTQPPDKEMAIIKTAQLRWLFIGPAIVLIFIMIGTLIASVYRQTNDEISRQVQMLRASASEAYQIDLEYLTGKLAGISGTLTQNWQIRKALADNNRTELSKLVEPIFPALQKEYAITQLYFIGADQTVLLRANDPGRFGDVINHITALNAQRTRAPTHGVELGEDGKLALRFVSPLYKDAAKQYPIGFIELEFDTSHLTTDIQKSPGIQMFEFLSKNFLKRELWQRDMPDPANQSEWDRFSDFVPSGQTIKGMTPEMSAFMSNRVFPDPDTMIDLAHGESVYRAISIPILDMEKHKVGSFVMLADVTSKVSNARNTLDLGLALGLAGGGILFAFFWLITGRAGKMIEHHQEALHHLATRDGLTGLFNHVTFYTMLEDEVSRSQRSGTPASLLMLDLDHFNSINNKFGHAAGDNILKEFGKIIHRQSRAIDKVFRYGGEEIAVILPETNANAAMVAAERMRSAVAGHLFKLNKGKDLSVTISIGVATVPDQATAAQELINMADRALHIAKEHGRNQVYRYNS
jgi:diguanylate cyclase (GGDEF)-like protein